MKTRIPSFLHHKGSGQGFVVLNNRYYYLGDYHDPRTRLKYERTITEWLARGRQAPTPPTEITIKELLARFIVWAKGYYTPTGSEPDYELQKYARATKTLRRLYGDCRAVEFGPLALQAVRQQMIENGWCRNNVNAMVNRIKTVFRWGTAQELIPASVTHGLEAVTGLRYGRTTARESQGVQGVSIAQVEAAKPFVSRQVAALIDLQLLTGARGGELLKLRPCEIDTSRAVWTYRPLKHKTALHGKVRTIYFGPRAQAVLRPFMLRPPDQFMFSPAEAEKERREALHQLRQAPLSSGNSPGTNVREVPRRKPGARYTANTYARAIARACEQAFPLPEELRPGFDQDGKPETLRKYRARLTPHEKERIREFRKAHRWHPHQLRHSAATAIRREFGLEAAQLALGHSSAQVTDAVYAERDLAKVEQVMLRIG